MRRSIAALFLVLTAAVGVVAAPAPVRAAQTSDAKVVIIVGATHSATTTYRGYADQAYAEAIKHTPNVVKIYSPNATWSKVKSATVGASVVIYFGHGNGWPSPYTYDPNFTTKDGFGLNATAGNGDNNNKYYGEPYVATLDLAPNAVVLLHHLCYAAGNSEPRHAEPTKSVAKQRVDNYGAGFLRAGAKAVFAEAITDPRYIIKNLYTSDRNMREIFFASPNRTMTYRFHFVSKRTSWAIASMDPYRAGKYYRSVIGKLQVTAAQWRAS